MASQLGRYYYGTTDPLQVQEMESDRAEHSSSVQEVRRENEELKEVLSAVQLDLEAGTEVGAACPGGQCRVHCCALTSTGAS